MNAGTHAGALAGLLSRPRQSAVLLDIDGTLAPIVERADEARVPEPTRRLLVALARRYALVACISGRQASEARAMVSIGTIAYVGAHGAELLRAGWTEAVLNPQMESYREQVEAFRRELDTGELRRCRVRVEDKGAIVAFHWRGAPDQDAAQVCVNRLAETAEAVGLHPHWGRKVLEIRPPVRVDKGDGVRELLADTDVDTVLYAGDDVTDLDAFAALGELRAAGTLREVIRVGVRSEDGPEAIVTDADLVVDGVTGVAELLDALAAGG